MVRALGAALAAALVLSVGPTEGEAFTKDRYSRVLAATVEEQKLARLFDEVVDFERVPCHIPHLFCAEDSRTFTGQRWLESKRGLRAKLDHVVGQVEELPAPRDIAAAQAAFAVVLRDCGDLVERLPSEPVTVDNLIAIRVFDREVARTVAPCFPALFEIGSTFDERGYGYLPGPFGGLVDEHGYSGGFRG
jgi:hypothetical protein